MKRKIKNEEKNIVHEDKIGIQEISQKIDLKNKYKAALKEISFLEDKQKIIEVFSSYKVDPYKIIPTKINTDEESIAIVCLSDVHCEEKVDANTINNLNEYNLEICHQRLEIYFKRILKLINIQRSGTKINEMVLAVLGDLISGTIHEELLEDNYLSPTQASLFIYNELISGINFLLEKGDFKKIMIPCCIGTHGRTTKDKRISTGYKNSFEWLMYNYLANYYKGNKRIEIIISNGYHLYVDVYGHLLRFHHGDALKYNGGIGGITIPANKSINEWNKAKKAYLDIFGHFHSCNDGGNYISNGSVIGYNCYALSIKAAYEDPKQMMFFMNQRFGKTITCPVFLK